VKEDLVKSCVCAIIEIPKDSREAWKGTGHSQRTYSFTHNWLQPSFTKLLI